MPPSHAKITICIPVFNGENFIEDALRSVQQQSYRGYQILVSDNCSSDATPEILERWRRQLPIEVHRQAVTSPALVNCNFLLDRIDTPYYLLLCHDDYLNSPEALAIAGDILDRNPDVSAVYCDLSYVNAVGRHLIGRRFHRSGRIAADPIGLASVRSARNMFGIPLLIRSDRLRSYRYDLSLPYVADVDLSWNLSADSFLYHVPQMFLANRYSGTNQTWNLLKIAAQQFQLLAAKHNIELSKFDRQLLVSRAWAVMQQKRVFGAYAALRQKA